MSQALRTVELPPEARALIEAGTPKPQTEHRVFGERAYAAGGNQPETREQTVPTELLWSLLDRLHECRGYDCAHGED